MSRAPSLTIVVLLLANCSSLPSVPAPLLIMGDAVCSREATQIYFSNQDDTLSSMAAQVISELSNKLARCTDRKVLLVAISGNDGAPATSLVAANRIKVVGDILISQGLNPARINAITTGPIVGSVPRGPVGGIVVMTKR